MENNKNKKSLLYIDILKIIACFLVIINHTNSRIFQLTSSNKLWFTSIFTFFICKMAVPIFILVSGALLLNKEYKYKKVVTKILKYIFILVLISIIYYIDYNTKNNIDMGIKDFIIKLCNNDISPHLWYMYLYISIILMCPFLQKMAKNMSNKDFKIFFIISIIINGGFLILIPHYYPNLNISNYLLIFHPYLGLLFSGYYIENRLEINKKNIVIIAMTIIILMPIISTYLTYIERIKNPTSYLFYDNISFIAITLPSIAFFIFIKLIIKNINKEISQTIKSISGTTFAIYLIHMLIVNNIYIERIYNTLQKYFPTQISMYIWEIIIFITSFIIAYILNKIIKIIKEKITFNLINNEKIPSSN